MRLDCITIYYVEDFFKTFSIIKHFDILIRIEKLYLEEKGLC